MRNVLLRSLYRRHRHGFLLMAAGKMILLGLALGYAVGGDWGWFTVVVVQLALFGLMDLWLIMWGLRIERSFQEAGWDTTGWDTTR